MITRVLIAVAVIIGIVFGISYYFGKEFKIMLEYAAIIVFALGAATFTGGRSLGVNPAYSKTHEYSRRHWETLGDSMKFSIFLGVIGVILLIIAVIIW